MDFFSQQEKARKYSRVLLLYFILAITFTVIAVNVIVYFFFKFIEFYPYISPGWYGSGPVYFISAGTIVLILAGSLYRWQKLKSGGHAVAEMLGARRVDLHTSDLQQRVLIHVVEEMSIASGVPLPALYVLEQEAGINAFVAGYQPTEAVMVVTRGALENLSREELQGVVGHEYSHILNGDMQINIHLIALLAGIVMISTIGQIFMRSSHVNSRGRSASALVVLGLLLLVVGSIGVFFGRLIKAAVSRQREYLADAASVQFTRNPQGLASALNKIRETSSGSILNNSHTEEMSHMCFSQAITHRFASWLATHPPILERIKNIDPAYLSRIKARQLSQKIKERNAQKNNSAINAQAGGTESATAFNQMNIDNLTPQEVTGFAPATGHNAAQSFGPVSASEFVNSAGQIDLPHLDYATKVHDSFSDNLLNAVHQTQSAQLTVYALIAAQMPASSVDKVLSSVLNKTTLTQFSLLKQEIVKLEKFQRLPLFDLLLPALKLLNNKSKSQFLTNCKQLIESDKKYTLFEFVLFSLLEKQLSLSVDSSVNLPENSQSKSSNKTKFFSFKPLNKELQLVFSVVARSSAMSMENCQAAYNKTAQNFSSLSADPSLTLLPMQALTTKNIRQSLQQLSQLSPLLKRNVLEACADIVMYDAQLKSAEAEMLRVIAEFLNCPLPPLLPEVVN